LTNKKIYDLREARAALERYCAIRERSIREVELKMRDMQLITVAQEEILVHLLQNNFLNERRYAQAFAEGHLRQTEWGKIKIAYALRQQGVADKTIQETLNALDETEYLEILQRVALKKWPALRERTRRERERKLFSFLQGKGFESSLIAEAIKTIP
jgi:regulatory protein